MYATYETSGRRSATRRTWLAAGGALAAILVLLILVAAACNARSNQNEPLAGAIDSSPTPTATAPDPAGSGIGGGSDTEQTDTGGAPSGNDNPGTGGNPGGGENPGQDDDTEDPDDAEEPVAPLSIDVAIKAVAPNGHCSASGTITVDGGEYPLTVDFQWRRLTFAAPLLGEPVSPVQSHTFNEPGGISVQTKDLPEDGLNVFLAVTSPKSAGSGVVTYDGCSGQAGGGSFGG